MKRYPKEALAKHYRSSNPSSLMDVDSGPYIVTAAKDYSVYDNLKQDETRDIEILGVNCKISKYEREVGTDFSEGEMFIAVTHNGNVIGSNYGSTRIAIQEAYEYIKSKNGGLLS